MNKNFALLIGIMTLFIIIYRITYIGLPFFIESFQKQDIILFVHGLTQLV